MIVAGIVLAAGGLLLIIAAQWDSFGESSQQRRVTGMDPAPGRDGWLACVRVVWQGSGR
jgi:hypothetical protein